MCGKNLRPDGVRLMPEWEPTPGLTSALKEWLREEGIAWFSTCFRDFGKVDPILNIGGLPHPVHFREGMQVRNFLRTLPETSGWTSHDYDNRWASLVRAVLGA